MEDKIMTNRNGWLPEVFNDFFCTDYMPRTSATAPAINVKETSESYIVEMAAPGMRKENFSVHINDEGDLTIKMEEKQEKTNEKEKAHYLRREFAYSKYEQTLILPEDVDRNKIAAAVADGVLTVTLPKVAREENKVSRQIEIG
jgi:HSP20 family protein